MQIAEYVCKRAYTDTRSACIDIVFDYALVYYCDMPAITTWMRDSMTHKYMKIMYDVMYTIVHDKHTNVIYATDKMLDIQNKERYNVLKYKDEMSKCMYTYTYTNNSYGKDTSTPDVSIKSIKIVEKDENVCVYNHNTYNKKTQTYVHYKVQYWQFADMCAMVQFSADDKIEVIDIYIGPAFSVIERCRCITDIVMNMAVPYGVQVSIGLLKTEINMKHSITLQTDNKMHNIAISTSELREMLQARKHTGSVPCANRKCRCRVPGQVYIRELWTDANIAIQNTVTED